MHVVDLSPVYGMLNEAILTLLGGLALFLASWGKKWLDDHRTLMGQKLDAQLADGLNRALQNGVAIAMQRTEEIEQEHPNLPIKSAIGAWAAQYAVNHSPDAMERFTGLTFNDLSLKALAYLPVAPEAGIKLGTPAVVEVHPLAPPTQ